MNRHHRHGWLATLRHLSVAGLLAATAQFAFAESEFAAAWGPSVGSTAPLLAALDQDGTQHNLETLKGPNGLLLVFNRSVDW